MRQSIGGRAREAPSRSLRRDVRGEGYIDTAILIVIVFTLLISLLFVFSIFTSYLSLNSQAKQLAHGIEVYGKADDETIRLVSNGAFTAGDVTVNTSWHNATKRTIQLKTPFTVTVERQIGIPVLRFVTGNTVAIKLRITASADGISEVYWKAGS